MKKYNKIWLILALALFIIWPKSAMAQGFEAINMDVDIDKDGLGHVSEIWQINESDNDFTERYKSIENLRGLKIEDFSVSMDGRKFKEESTWDIDQDFDQKAYKYGRIDAEDDQVELCWGISKRDGTNSYKLAYTISPLVIGLNDADMVFFEFIGSYLDPKPNEFRIKINSYKPIGDEVKIWAFGYEGDINKEDGQIIARSTGNISKARIMVKFPKGTFATSFKEDKVFADYQDQALAGANFDEIEGTAQAKDESDLPIWIAVITGIFGLSLGGFAIVKAANARNIYKFTNIKEIPDIKNIGKKTYGQIPYDGNIEDLFLLATNAYPLSPNFENFIQAFFLKWINEGAISYKEDKKDHGAFKKSLDEIKIIKSPESMGEVEAEFFGLLKAASQKRSSGIITPGFFEDYMKDQHKTLTRLREKIKRTSLDSLLAKGYVQKIEIKKRKGKTRQKVALTNKGMDLYQNFLAFKNYLENYEDIDIKNIPDTRTLDGYMVYAGLYGISEPIYDSLVDAYPAYASNSFFNYYLIRNISSFSTTAATGSQTSSYGGSGGSASFSGGAGGFGGGGGGGR